MTECFVEKRHVLQLYVCINSVWELNEDKSIDLTDHALTRTKRWGFRIRIRLSRLITFVGNAIPNTLQCIGNLPKCLFGGRPSDTTPPRLVCPFDEHVIADPIMLYARLWWLEPVAQDDTDGIIQPYRVGNPPGKSFPNGTTWIQYIAQDRSNNRASCQFRINVEVITCSQPPKIENGFYLCAPSIYYMLGTTCSHGCYEGFELVGERYITCRNTSNWSASPPRCQPVTCKTLSAINHARLNCTDGDNFGSICSYTCDKGYDMAPASSRTLVCNRYGLWSGQGKQECIDVEPPVLLTCPRTFVVGTEPAVNTSTVAWTEPAAFDNSPSSIIIQLQSAIQSGSKLVAGKYRIEYGIRDQAGNKGMPCAFDVIVKDIQCHSLYSTPYMRIDCPFGYRSGFYCNISCDPGKVVKGNAFVVCDKSPKGLYGFWNWQDGQQAICQSTHSCHPLIPPTNGAVVCDNWMGGEMCQLQCQTGKQMADDMLGKLLVCHSPGGWWALNAVLPQPHVFQACTNITSARLLQKLEATYEYMMSHYNGSCNNPDTRRQIAEHFILILRNTTEYKLCVDAECNVDNVQIVCGPKDRQKRDIQAFEKGTLNISVTIPVNDFDVAQSVKQVVSDIVHNKMGSIHAEMTLHLVAFKSLGVSLQCPDGNVRAGNTADCVMCPEGTFYSAENTCNNCPKGSFQDQKGQSACTRCPFGATTRYVGSSSSHDCEDACPPGSYSSDGLQPCTPCEIGSFQSSYGQNNCDACKHSKSTVSYGSQSRLDCQEFDIVFPMSARGSIASATLPLAEVRLISSFSLTMWIKWERVSRNATMTISFLDESEKAVWTIENLKTISSKQRKLGSNNMDLLDSKWHMILITYNNCNISYNMDMMAIEMQHVAGECIPLYWAAIKIKSEAGTIFSLSQLNVWSSRQVSPQSRKCFSRESGGDILAWKQFERADLDGSFIDSPSVCDDFNNCVSSPCLNGNCTDELNAFTCHCHAGFTGQQCEVDIDDCSANVCMNNASCMDEVTSYSCACSSAFTGRFCEIAIVNGQWSEWSQWSECSATCGEGTRFRTRRCNSPQPANGGDECRGAVNETTGCDNSKCPVCQPLGEIENGTITCDNISDTIRCNISCNEDHDFDFVPLEEYVCGPDTFHMWNFESRFNPQRRLPSCVAARAPEALSASYAARYKDLYCSTNEMTSLAHMGIEHKIKRGIKNLPCVLGNLCSVSYTISSCNIQTRRKREASSIGFTIKTTLILQKGEANSSMNTLQNTLLAIYESAIEGVFNVTVLDDVYQVDLTGMSLTGDVQCSGNDVARSFYCIPCGKGAYKSGDQCSHCPVGQYQDEVGKASCISCPYGFTTIGEGSTSPYDCKGDKTNNRIQEAASYLGIIAGSLTATIVVLVSLLVYRRYRQSMNKVSSIAQLPEKDNGPSNMKMIWKSETTVM
ncbi:uncharacterized protein LOC127842990 isoform X2 [Dreissena polymorpha]|nr:uncharacterized protein LOC127842990 isoform X2 [Dreissena polymorpha]